MFFKNKSQGTNQGSLVVLSRTKVVPVRGRSSTPGTNKGFQGRSGGPAVKPEVLLKYQG